MRLTRVEILGFKSFSERTILDLPRGLTAIVGPNGCGKSNVIDAIKWALGEQKASALRGAEMLDVIFKGNGARAARNFAEVSLVFDNADGVLPIDYAEVVITRRLFRNGESEYLINREATRLKDVRNLLMDTGLGTGAYAVMEQGRIDAVLSANPHERRRIFEEAAGISRYRARRRESESKLARTEQNLLRLGDVVEELEKQQRSLKVQAGRARSYLEARDRLRELRALYYQHEWTVLGEALGEREALVASCSVEEQRARAALEEARAQVGVLQQGLAEVRGHVDEAAEAFRLATTSAESLGERQAALKERLAEADDRRQQLEARVIGLDRAVEGRREELREVERRLELCEQELAASLAVVTAGEASTAEAEEADQRWTVAALERRAAAQERAERLTSTRRERAEAEARHAALLATRDRVATHLGELAAELEQQVSLQGELFAGARDLDGALAEARSHLDRRRGQRSAILDGLARFEGELLEQREALAAAASRREALEELISRRDGVSPGAVALVGSELPGIEGLLVDDLRAPAHLAEAVEAALGATTQAVLVASRAHGLAALEHLRDVKGGRVLLAPRDAMRPRQGAALGRRLLDELDVRDHADVMEALLGHVRLVPDRVALEHCTPDGVTVWVTPQGDLLDERGVLCGGTSGEEGGLVSRRAERDALGERCEQLRARIHQLDAERQGQLEAQLAVEQQLAQAETAVRRLESDRERTRERERQSAERTEALQEEQALREGEHASIEEERGRVSTTLAEASAREQELAQAVARDADQAEADEEQAGRLRQATAAARAALAEARTDYEARKERRDALAGECTHVQRGVDDLQAQRDEAREEVEALQERVSRLTEEQDELARRSVTLAEERDRAAGTLGERKRTASRAGEELEQAQAHVVTREADVEQYGEALASHRMATQETSIRREELRRKVLEELEIDLAVATLTESAADDAVADAGDAEPVEGQVAGGEEAAAEPIADEDEPEDRDWEEVAATIEQLRTRMARMGNVNLAAVEELGGVEERLGFLVGQRDDLLEARKSLSDTIEHLNKESRERFVEAFETVRGHFREIFRKLFRGGRADIRLEEGEDVLEAGIEIIAAPPGKDSRAITLLSGGERTLTAVGMLFALFRSRPSPVSLLDEVDAALDETNIDRFCTVLEDFLEESQFVVVTHARRTMSYADTIYGVTMQEHGVSKVLGVSVEQYEAGELDSGRVAPRPAVQKALAGEPSVAAATEGQAGA